MEKIVITRAIVGLCHMQVCAEETATDEEILAVCNRGNPSGTELGWCHVIRTLEKELGANSLPVPCADYPGRKHFLVSC